MVQQSRAIGKLDAVEVTASTQDFVAVFTALEPMVTFAAEFGPPLALALVFQL